MQLLSQCLVCVCVCVCDVVSGVLLAYFFSQAWLRENFVHSRNMKTVLEVRRQLQGICQRNEIQVTSLPKATSQSVRMALLRGLFMNVAEAQDSGYRTVGAGGGSDGVMTWVSVLHPF